MNKPTSARDEAEKVFSGLYTGACNVDAITKAIERAERRGELKAFEEMQRFCAERKSPKDMSYFEKEADRLESELNTEPGEGSK